MRINKLLSLFLLAFLLIGCTVGQSDSPLDPIDDSEPGDDSDPDDDPNEDTDPDDDQDPDPDPDDDQDPDPDPVLDHIVVFAPTHFTHVYAWVVVSNVQELVGSWPGTTLNAYDEEWKTYSFDDYTSLNLIFSENGNNQTKDLSISTAGNYWYSNGTMVNEKPSGNDEGDGGEQEPIEVIDKASWKDFSFWDEYDDNYWTTINKYNGDRKDFRDETIYFTITTRFYDGDSGNNIECWDGRNGASDPAWRGDFKGLINKMDYIKALGFTAIWITPVVENCSGYDYHGYHAFDFNKVDPRYLSQDVSFQTVINEAHARDMKIILDVVFNHTGNFGERTIFPMFEKSGDLGSIDCLKLLPNSGLPSNYSSLSGGEQYNARIANMKNTKNDGSDPNNIYHHYGNFSWESFGEQVAQIAGDCVDLNTENPYVAEFLVKTYGQFIRMGVDGFRIDTMKHISRLTLNNYFFGAFYEYAKRCGNTGFYMFGEVCTRVCEVWNHNIPALSAPFYTWKETKDYDWDNTTTNMASIEKAYEDNKSVDNEPTSNNAKLNGISYHTPDYSASSGVGVIDFPMHWNFRYASDAFRVATSNDQYYNDASYNVMYVDSHDYAPDGIEKYRYIEGTEAWAENMSLMFTFRGIPCILYGSEIEFQKGKVIDNGPNTVLSQTGRAYYGDHLEGSVTASDFGVYSATGEVKSTLSSTLSLHLQKLNKIRSAVPALRQGQYTLSGVSGNMAYIRRYTSGSIDSLALVTISSKASFSNIPNGTYVDLVSGARKTVTNGSLQTDSISKGNARIYVLENASTGTLSRIGDSLTYLH